MDLSRRSFLTGVGVAAAAGTLAACGGGNGSATAPTSESGPVTLRFVWWGNDTRTRLTNQVIELFQSKNPTITIKGENGDFSTYWDKLATQVAGNDAPDIIQMDEKYINEYGARGALLDLGAAGVITDKFAAGTLDSGRIGGALLGINSGINAPVLLANKNVIAAAGSQLPDDATLTWDAFTELCSQITGRPQGVYGTQNPLAVEAAFRLYMRQLGKDEFDANGLGFAPADAAKFFDLGLRMMNAKASPPAAEISEDMSKPIDQAMASTNKVAYSIYWSNQINSIKKASGSDIALLRPPSMTGKASDVKLWYKASMYWSAYAKTKHPAAVATFINFLANDVEAGKIMGTERGVPANNDVKQALSAQLSDVDKLVVDYLDRIGPELGGTAVVAPVGGGQLSTMLTRYSQDVVFGRQTPQQAGQAFYDEAKSNLK
jgi:multiple sugar transport system substrate-binding protein